MISNAPQVSANAIRLLREFEGCELTAYQDIGGVWTIGFGDTENVFEGLQITMEEAERRLRSRLKDEFEFSVWKICCTDTPTAQEHFDAMVLLCYNIGARAFEHSSLAGYHADSLYSDAEQEFAKWNKVKNRVINGLVRRRAKEAHLYRIGTDSLRRSPSAALRV